MDSKALDGVYQALLTLEKESSRKFKVLQEQQIKLIDDMDQRMKEIKMALENKVNVEESERDRNDVKVIIQELRQASGMATNVNRRLDKLMIVLKGKVDRAELERCIYIRFLFSLRDLSR